MLSSIMRPKLSTVCRVERNAVLIMPSQHPLRGILTCEILSKKVNYFTVCNCNVLQSIVCFRNFAFRLLKISIEFFLIDSTKSSRPVPEIRPIRTSNQNHNIQQENISGHDHPPPLEMWFLIPLYTVALSGSALFRATRDSGDSATQPTLLHAGPGRGRA